MTWGSRMDKQLRETRELTGTGQLGRRSGGQTSKRCGTCGGSGQMRPQGGRKFRKTGGGTCTSCGGSGLK